MVKTWVGQRLGRHDLDAELQRRRGDSGFVSRAHLEGRRIKHLRGRAAYHTRLGIEVDTLRQRWTDTVVVHVAFHAGLHGHGHKVRVDEFLARIRQARGWCTRDGKRDPCSGLPILVFSVMLQDLSGVTWRVERVVSENPTAKEGRV